MKPYGIRNKFCYNYTDCHPKKGFLNWWEVELGIVKSKKLDRIKSKKEILKELKNNKG